MITYPFAISLNPAIEITTAEDQYTLAARGLTSTALLNLATTPGLSNALKQLQEGRTTAEALVQALAEREGKAAGEQFAVTLQQLQERGWLCYAVLPLAVAIPMVQTAKLNLSEPGWTHSSVSLSRFAYQHSYENAMVLESPLSPFRVKLLDWRASALIAQLAQPQFLARLTPPPYLGPETAYQFLNLLWASGFLSVDSELPSLQLWDFHNLLFHSRSRLGRHDYPGEDIQRCIDQWSDFPVIKPPMSDKITPLPRPSLEGLMCNDAKLTEAIEARESIREYDEMHPIRIEQLGELLYRTARVKEVYRPEDRFGDDWKRQAGLDLDFEYGESRRRPYPSAGAMYELEIYLVVRHCEGLLKGLYHYDPLNHQLEQIAESEDVLALEPYVYYEPKPQVLLVITARFGRLFRKYRSVAYALVLKHVGVLQHNLYLVATNMGLAPCALGSGDSDGFGRAARLDYVEESAVGEFMLGSRLNWDVAASRVESSTKFDIYLNSSKVSNSVNERAFDKDEVEPEPADVGCRSLTQPTDTTESVCASDKELIQVEEIVTQAFELDALEEPVETIDAEDADILVNKVESDSGEDKIELSATLASEVKSSATRISVALHPHDLDNSIPGLVNLRNQTLGDPRIMIVILDGSPDHTLSCFEGAEVSKVFPYWHETPEPISPEDHATYREIDNSDLKGKAKLAALEAALSDSLADRIYMDRHACHVTSVIVGQEHTPAPGLAPNCRVINVPINSMGSSEMMSPLNLARAFELALDLGANIIHCAACRPTQTSKGEEILVQAVKKCQDNNILIVAPAGNDEGKCWCIPAVLPETLAVGAMKTDGTPQHYSNWGGNYVEEGIMAPGEDILCAQPATEEPVRQKGTSIAAPIMTGISALLMSLQLQEGKPVDAEAVRMALLNTAIPCNPEVVEEPDRCLRGFVNIPGAMKLLFGQPSITISFAGDQVTRTERPGYAMPSPAVQPATPTEASVIAAADSDAAPVESATVEASTAHSGHVYALGTIGYDFGDDARRDTFKQLMAPAEIDGIIVPPDPYDPRQMLDHLDRYPDEGRSLIWTLNLDQNTLYVLEPKRPFAEDIYEMFLQMLAGQLEPETSDGFVERISVPARRTTRTVELFSGEVVPVVTVNNVRGMYGWTVNALVNAALVAISNRFDPDQDPLIREALSAFLNRVYHDLRNLGQTSRDRALNFAATNIFQSASVFAEAIASGRQLDTIEVKKSPYCRINSDCWDVLLIFFDPENGRRSRRVFRFTLDVALNMPVTIGRIKRWSIPGKKR